MVIPPDATAGVELRGPEGLPSGHPGRLPALPTVATLYKRGSRYYLNWREDGVQIRRSLGAIDRKEAEAVRAKKEAELRGLITPTREVLVGDVLDGYLRWYREARPTTYNRAASALKPFLAQFGRDAAESLPPDSIERWAHAQTATGSTEKALKLAQAAFRRAIRQRSLTRSPMDGVSIPKPLTSRAPDYYRPAQLRTLAKHAGSRAPLWTFMVDTGIRRGEMAKARREDVRDGMLYVESLPSGRTKNRKWRAIPLTPDARAALRKLGDDRLVDVHPDTLSDWFSADAKAAKLPGSLHWLRHTFCTALVQSGVSLHEVKRLAGHSSITVTERYAHHMPDFGRAAVATMAAWKGPDKHKRKHSQPRKPTSPRSSAG